MTLTQLLLDNLEWLILSAIGLITAFVTLKLQIRAIEANAKQYQELNDGAVTSLTSTVKSLQREAKDRAEKHADILNAIQLKQGALESELRYGKESIDKQLSTLEIYMIQIRDNTKGTS